MSPNTVWEVAMLVAKGKMSFSISPDIWFERFFDLPGVALAEMPPSVLIASDNLPGAPPSDPVDRILVATARDLVEVRRPRSCRGHGMLTQRREACAGMALCRLLTPMLLENDEPEGASAQRAPPVHSNIARPCFLYGIGKFR